MIKNIEQWKKDIIYFGKIIQDNDNSVDSNEAEKRFKNYIKLVDCVEGNESEEIALYLIKSLQVNDDYGAYQTTLNKIFSFKSEIFVKVIITDLPRLIDKNLDWAGELLSCITSLIQSGNNKEISIIFKKALQHTPNTQKEKIVQYIKNQEREGWLENEKGVLKY